MNSDRLCLGAGKTANQGQSTIVCILLLVIPLMHCDSALSFSFGFLSVIAAEPAVGCLPCVSEKPIGSPPAGSW
jgi:hypothetical protein